MSPSTRSARGQRTLAREFYVSPEIFAEEIERIFLDRWLYAGRAPELVGEGAHLLFEVDGECAIVVRGSDGRLRAFHNVCRHRGTRLCQERAGSLGKTIRCPYHAWTYDLDGRLAGAPHMDEVPGFDPADWPLLPVALAEWEGGVFLHFGASPVEFEQAFAPLVGRFEAWRLPGLVVAAGEEYEVAANWKLLFQNYSECYHCPGLHPLLNRRTHYRESWNEVEEGPILGGPMRLARSGGSMTMSGARCAAPLGTVAGDDLDRVHYYSVFPNLLLSVHPDYVLSHRIEPLAADRSRVACQWLFDRSASGAPDFSPADAVEFWHLTNGQDWRVCEQSQQGVASRAYRPGPYAEIESNLAAFDREYLRAMGRA